MEDRHRVRFKVGNIEFEAEGEADLVHQQFLQTIQALKGLPVAQIVQVDAEAAGTAVQLPPDGEGGTKNGSTLDDLVSRVLQIDGAGLVSLRLLPQTDKPEADALLLLLYGYQRLANIQPVLAIQLSKSARQSGLQLERIDRDIMKHKSLIGVGGAAKGRRYSLNNQGLRRAEEILRAME